MFLYRFSNNDPVNWNSSSKKYMNTLTEWMELFNIKPPEEYFGDGRGGIFGQSMMEHSIQFDFGRSRRRPLLWNRIKSEAQLFGPNIAFWIHNATPPTISPNSSVVLDSVSAVHLQGAGTVEQIMASLLNSSTHLVQAKLQQNPLSIDIIVASEKTLPLEEEYILKRSITGFEKTSFNSSSIDSDQYRIDIQLQKCHVAFWIGFDVKNDEDVIKIIMHKKYS